VQQLERTSDTDWLQNIMTDTGISVPFSFEAMQNGTTQTFVVTDVKCAHASIGNAPTDEQPSFSGVP